MFVISTSVSAMLAMVAVVLVYAIFDIFNGRNVPTMFAYGALLLSALFTLSIGAGNVPLLEESALIAVVILAVGYLMYKAGQLGAADVLEFATISLFMPLQTAPLLAPTSYQYNIPFIVSVFISAGVVALALIPIYYVPRAARLLKKPIFSRVSKKDVPKALTITAAYAAFLIFLTVIMHAKATLLAVIAIVMVSSVATILYEKPITDSMVSMIYPRQLEDQDIVALNLMSSKDIARIKRKVKGFNKLVSDKMIKAMQKSFPKLKIPVYRSAMPMALPILIGTVISLLVGNLLLYLF